MADVFTPELSLVKPEVGQSVDTWGTKLNSNMDKLDVAHTTLETTLLSAINTLRTALVGMVVGFPLTSAPQGWLKCNGAAVSRTTYADLFARIGTAHGNGDGSTTFNLPDYRGVFPRWLDDGAGIDSGRSITSLQQDEFQSHDHPASSGNYSHSHYGTTNTSGYHDHPVSASANGNHRHRLGIANGSGSGSTPEGDPSGVDSATNTDYAGNHSHTIYLSPNGNHTHSFSTNTNTHNHSISIGNAGGAETRPVNRALLACILY